MNQQQLERMHQDKGFIAALDQSGGSTPKALEQYGITKSSFKNDEEMYQLVHDMRTRIIKSPSFTSDKILGAILFENTMDRMIDDKYTADFLWEEKGIVPFLKIDQGLAPLENGVQLMKDIPGLDNLLERANERHVFGTKMRSVIKEANPKGIKDIVAQQFEVATKIIKAGLVPILEPEVDINIPDKKKAEKILLFELITQLSAFTPDTRLMFKVTIPTETNLYKELMVDPRVVRVVALSGGYSQKDANEKLSQNAGLIASFSRALSQGLQASQTDEEFDNMLKDSIDGIYKASIS